MAVGVGPLLLVPLLVAPLLVALLVAPLLMAVLLAAVLLAVVAATGLGFMHDMRTNTVSKGVWPQRMMLGNEHAELDMKQGG